jgi:hypothetical protein
LSKSTELANSAAVRVSRDASLAFRRRGPDQGNLGPDLSLRQRRRNARGTGTDHRHIAKFGTSMAARFVHARLGLSHPSLSRHSSALARATAQSLYT